MVWRSPKIYIAAIAILIVCLVALIFFANQEAPPAAAGKKAPESLKGGNNLPTREGSLLPLPQYPQNDPRFPALTAPPMQGTSQPEMNIPPGLAPIPPEGKAAVYPLATPPTQVHSLSEAGAMGLSPNPGAEVGVPRVHALPPEAQTKVYKLDPESITAPLGTAGKAIGAPPGVPPDEVGRTKTAPVKKDKK